MEISAAGSTFQKSENLVAAPKIEAEKNRRLEEACCEFEAVLLRQVLGESLKPLLATPPGQSSHEASTYLYLTTSALADGIAKAQETGISHLLQAQLSGNSADIEEKA